MFPSANGNADLFKFHTSAPKSQSDPAMGNMLAQWLISTSKTSPSGYYSERNRRFEKNRQFAKGRQPMEEYLDLIDIDAKDSYVNLDMKAPAIAPKFMDVLIGRFMERDERPTVSAVDPESKRKKRRDKDEAEFRMRMGGEIGALSQEGGVPLEDPDAYIPEDENDMELYFETEYRMPEEVKFERLIKTVLDDNGYNILKRRILEDLSEVGISITKTYIDDCDNIKVRACIPENCVYSYSNFDDFRDISFAGEYLKLKVSELRKMYPEKDETYWHKLWASTNQDGKVDISWVEDYRYMYYRPYDDAVIEVLDFEVKTTQDNIWVSKKDSRGRIKLDKKQTRPTYLGENKELIEKKIAVIYHGVKAVASNDMLEWKLMENMIKPHYSLHECFSSYAIHMYKNRDMVNMSMVERVETSIRMMTVNHLKLQQLIAQMRPDGLIVDISGLTGVNLGTGDGPEKPLELLKIYNQTGNVFYNSLDVDGENRKVSPITPSNNDANVGKIQTLISTYNFYLQRLRDDLGINEYAEGNSVNPKLGLGVLESQVSASNRATNFIYDAFIDILEQTAKRVAILAWDNVVIRDMNYDDIVSKEDIKDKYFDVNISMLPTDAERQYIDGIVNSALSNGLLDFEHAFKIRRIAKENVKLAEIYLSKYTKQKRKEAQQDAMNAAQANAQQQIASAQAAQQGEAQLEQFKIQGEIQKQNAVAAGDKNKVMATMVSTLITESFKTGTPIPAMYQPMVDAYMQNILTAEAFEAYTNQKKMEQMAAMEQQQAMQQQAQEQEGVGI